MSSTQRVQALRPQNLHTRVQYSEWIQRKYFTDEAGLHVITVILKERIIVFPVKMDILVKGKTSSYHYALQHRLLEKVHTVIGDKHGMSIILMLCDLS